MFDLRFTIRTFVEALVCFHVESHVAFCALEARLVPCLKGRKIIIKIVDDKHEENLSSYVV
jgi:hypothetical protein